MHVHGVSLKIALGTGLIDTAEEKAVQAYELSNRLPGVIEAGADAHLLRVDGNPLEVLELFDDPDPNLVLITKDGAIHKNTIRGQTRIDER